MLKLKRQDNLSLLEILVLIMVKKIFVHRSKLKQLTTSKEIMQARKLQAKVYLRKGNVNKNQLTSDGLLDKDTDPYVGISQYFGIIKKGKVVASGRVLFSKDRGKLQISSEVDLSTIDTSQTVCELSGFAKESRSGKFGIPTLTLFILEYCFSNYDYVMSAVTEQPYKKFMYFAGPITNDFSEPFVIKHGNNLVYPVVIKTGVTKKDMKKVSRLSRYGYSLLINELKA